MLVIHNTSKPESTLKKKCNALAYHSVLAVGETLTGHIRSDGNLADFLKTIITGHKYKHLVS